MQKKIIISLLLLILSCDNHDVSIGNANTITVISSIDDRAYSEHIIEHFFQGTDKMLKVPQEEYLYKINWADLNNLDSSIKMRNVLLLSLSYPADSTADILSGKIMKENNITNDIAVFSDLFASPQRFAVLRSTDAIELEKQLESHSSWILSEYDQNVHSIYYDYLLKNDSNHDLEQNILDKFKLSIFIQEDYKEILSSHDFLWIGRGYPYRWLIFYRVPESQKNNNPYNVFSKISKSFNLGLSEIENRDYHKKTKLSFGDNKALLDVFRGIYNHDESGGPFALYLLDNIYDDELILVASIINNPGKSKMPHLLQMDALINNSKFLGE